MSAVVADRFHRCVAVGHAHLDGIEDRHLRLVFQRRRMTVQKRRLQQDYVQGRRCIALAQLILDPLGHRQLVCEPSSYIVTGGTRDRTVGR